MRVLLTLIAAAVVAVSSPVSAKEPHVSILVPITGFLAIEGTAQRNGAVLALEEAASVVPLSQSVLDTATSPEKAVTALRRTLSRDDPIAVVGSIFGTQMLAMLPIAQREGVPIATISGTAKLTELGNPWIFRFFPGDSVVKVAHADYVLGELGAKRPALIYQTTAYGQSGREHLARILAERGVPLVAEEAVEPAAKDMTGALARVRAAEPDVLLLHLHSRPTALAIRQSRALGMELPVVAGSAMHQPTTAALLEPEELEGVCAETASSPISDNRAAVRAFTAAYRKRFDQEPDAFALAQYDGTRMIVEAVLAGASSPEGVRDFLSSQRFDGLAMAYRTDGTGNMAHDAVIVCYDGKSRIPAIVARYSDVNGVLAKYE